MARFGGVHAFGYNSAESEPIWMKSGALLRAGPGRFWAPSAQQRQANFCQVRNARFYRSRRPNFTKFEHNTSIGVAMKTLETEF